MPVRKILWLTSWYPNKLSPFDGDFIQRHGRAAALYNDVHVIHVAGDSTGRLNSPVETEAKHSGRLTEQFIYFKKSNSFLHRLVSNYRWLYHFRKAVKKYVAEYGKPDIVHVHVAMKAGLIGLWIKRRYNIPFIVTEHWGIYNEIADDNYLRRSTFFKIYTRKIFKQAAGFVSVSSYLAQQVNKMVIHKRFTVIPNVVDTELFFYKPVASQKFRFIHVSNMVPLKNVEGILRAVKTLSEEDAKSDFELVMVGDTDPAIRDYANDLGLLNRVVSFRGEIPYEQVAAQMQAAHCLILFSNIENSPCVIGEALCCGLPVIATRVGGVPELLDKSNGVLIVSKNEEMLTEAIVAMMRTYFQFDRKKIAEDAQRKFSYATIGKLFNALYNKM